MTEPIDYGADCNAITSKLENIPNFVIPHQSVLCLQWKDYNTISSKDESVLFQPNLFFGIKTTLAFPKNPGILKQPKLNINLDGVRPTLYSTDSLFPVEVLIYPDGFIGEEIDYFSENCIGVDVSILSFTSSDGTSSYQFFTGLSPLEFRLLAQCLGDADGIDNTDESERGSGRVQGQDYVWDFGTKYNPHLVRLVDRTDPMTLVTDLCLGTMNSVRDSGVVCNLYKPEKHPPGFLVPLYYDPFENKFKIFTKPGVDYNPLTTFSIFTTKGTAQMVSDVVKIVTNTVRPYSQIVYSIRSNSTLSNSNISPSYQGNIDCESNQPNNNGALDCIDKGDRVFFLDPSLNQNSIQSNPKYLNIYTVQRIFRSMYNMNTPVNEIDLDMSLNSAWTDIDHSAARVYIYHPPDEGYQYVSECSNRGNCNKDSGQCECFTGFHGDDCAIQNYILS